MWQAEGPALEASLHSCVLWGSVRHLDYPPELAVETSGWCLYKVCVVLYTLGGLLFVPLLCVPLLYVPLLYVPFKQLSQLWHSHLGCLFSTALLQHCFGAFKLGHPHWWSPALPLVSCGALGQVLMESGACCA